MTQAKILIVEDSPTYLRQISNMLQNMGYRTVTASDGEEALEKAVEELEETQQRIELTESRGKAETDVLIINRD